MKTTGSFAGVGNSAARVVESYSPESQRLFDDPFAYKVLPLGWRVMVRLLYLPGVRSLVLSLRERRMPGSLGGLLCRTRYIDDVLKSSLEEGVRQVVILGAGFDTRPYRIDGMDQVAVFEVDRPGVMEFKKARVEKALGAVPEYMTFVGMDFEGQTLEEELMAAGFCRGQKTFCISEGVTQYISAEAVDDTFEFVTRVAGPGSAIVFTYVLRGIVDGTEAPRWCASFLSFASRIGSPWIFGLKPAELEGYLADRGLSLVDDVGALEYRERYLSQLGRNLSVFEGERAALAKVTEAPPA